MTVVIVFLFSIIGCLYEKTEAAQSVRTLENSPALESLMEQSTSFILARHYQMGGSQYSYTQALTDESDHGPADMPGWVSDPVFIPGSKMMFVELKKKGNKVQVSETVLIDSPEGVVRDPEVSTDGSKLLFSWKKSTRDEYHLYEMNLNSKEITQITFGSGAADIEPRYLPDGRILFNSTRCVQTIDCWYASVTNLFICEADGSNIIRLTYDQVSLTYPTVTSDGRVIYTRWEYNDKTALFAQGIFQMNPDGTNQTELYGNQKSFITSLLHTREIPGTEGKYLSIASGHHTKQAGKLVCIDISEGRNDKDAITFINKDKYCMLMNETDEYGQKGAVYKYPYPITKNLFLVSYASNGWDENYYKTQFGIYLMDMNGEGIELVSSGDIPASQIVPIQTRTLFNRASMVNYGTNTGTYYVADVYQGEAMKGIERGTVKYLRVVALSFRAYSIGGNEAFGSGTASMYTPISTGNGSWDVKRVLGVVKVEEDGSAMFKVPSETPVYFQLMDEKGSVIQTMRSWSTLMPRETFSCVGCHEDKNTTPSAANTVTSAMKKGVQELQPDVWQNAETHDPYNVEEGFNYLKEIQPIIDKSCIKCHTDTDEAYDAINMTIQTKKKYTDNAAVPVSLKGDLLTGDREEKKYPLSYLVLTQSWLTFNEHYYWTAYPEKNTLTTWYAAQSRVEQFKPYTYGSSKSKLMDMLRSGHGNLAENQIKTFAAWIDLGVPAFGSYTQNAVWDNDAQRKAEEETNKREYYDMLDKYAKKARAAGGTLLGESVQITYQKSDGSSYKVSSAKMAILQIPTKLSAGDKVTVTLPKGQKYLMFTLSSRIGESMIYVPDGVFIYTVPDLSKAYPERVQYYENNTVVARLPDESELKEEHNIANNPYDLYEQSGAYPHVTASKSHSDEDFFKARNIIDGFTGNQGSGEYPYQSWQPEVGDGSNIKIDFGRIVSLDNMNIRIRSAKGDTYIVHATLEFSSGQTLDVPLSDSIDMQSISLPNIDTSYVIIRDIQLAQKGRTIGIAELQFYGVEK